MAARDSAAFFTAIGENAFGHVRTIMSPTI
jgi:hypothetical protein